MSASAYWIRLAGRVPLSDIVTHSAPTWETLADGGCGQGTVDLLRPPRFLPSILRPGALFEVMLGMKAVYGGQIQDSPAGSTQIAAAGAYKALYDFPAMTAGGATTRVAAQARDGAWSRGLAMSDLGDVATSGLGTAPGDSLEPQSVGALYDQCAQARGVRWGLTPARELYARADPTTPSITITPDAGAFGTTSDGLASHLIGRYFDGSSWQSVERSRPGWVPGSPRSYETYVFSREEWGTLTAGQVTTLLDNAAAKSAQGWGWVNPITVTSEQIMTLGGVPFRELGLVRAGRMAQLLGSSVGASWSTRAVIGRTRYTAGQSVIHLDPVGAAKRTLADLIGAKK